MAQDSNITLRIATEHLEKLDKLRKKEDDLPTRAEMIRRLIERAK